MLHFFTSAKECHEHVNGKQVELFIEKLGCDPIP